MVCASRGNTFDLHITPTTMTNLTSESFDQELNLDQLNAINAGGKLWDKI